MNAKWKLSLDFKIASYLDVKWNFISQGSREEEKYIDT